jgi:hypothetical protein
MDNYLHEILPYYSEWLLHEFMHVCEPQQACIFISLISYWRCSYPNKQVLEVFYDQTLESQSARWARHELLQHDYWWRQEQKARIPSEAYALKTFRSWTMTNEINSFLSHLITFVTPSTSSSILIFLIPWVLHELLVIQWLGQHISFFTTLYCSYCLWCCLTLT